MERKATFDYGNMKLEHKEAAEEIVRLCEANGNEVLAELIKKNFNLVVRPIFNPEDTEFFKYCKQANIFPTVQGIMVDYGQEIDYPVVAICDDIRKIENLVNIIKESK